MSGKHRGTAALIQQEEGEDKAFYTHCMAHGLNLCIIDTCQIKEVQAVWANLNELLLFFSNLPKRDTCLKKKKKK